MNYGRTYIEIDLDAVRHNVDCIKNKIPKNTKLLTVVKADAYGHGAVKVAKALSDRSDFFGVASVSEGVQLRKEGIENPILVLGYSDENDVIDAVKHDISVTVFTVKGAKCLSAAAVSLNKTAKYHIAVDIGMSRIGLWPTCEGVDIVKEILSLPMIKMEGIFSHFAQADESDLSVTINQKKVFSAFLDLLSETETDVGIRHVNNSAAIINLDDSLDMVRAGIITYGLYPSHEVDRNIIDLYPVMSWKSHIYFLKKLGKGHKISYGGTYEAEKDMLVATVPVGYADGYPRCLSNKGKVIINGSFAPVVGRVCMDFLMVDVTDIPDVKEGDTVTIVGKDGGLSLSMDDVADEAYSFNYELPCRITHRVTRVYKYDGKEEVEHRV